MTNLSAAPPSPSSTSTSSLYTTPPRTPLRPIPIDTILDASSPRVQQLDHELDDDSSAPPTPSSATHSHSSLFDSEQLSVRTEPSPACSPPQPQRASAPAPAPAPPPPAPRASFLSRASQTFYAAIRKPISRAVMKHSAAAAAPAAAAAAGAAAGRPLWQLLDAQMSALQSAHGGFVELGVVEGLTRRTLSAIEGEMRASLRAHEAVRARCAVLAARAAAGGRAKAGEVGEKERLLVQAKLSAAEASDSVERLKLQLVVAKRQLALPQRLKTRTKRHLAAQALLIREARSRVQRRLAHARAQRLADSAALKRAHSEYRAIQGDWA